MWSMFWSEIRHSHGASSFLVANSPTSLGAFDTCLEGSHETGRMQVEMHCGRGWGGGGRAGVGWAASAHGAECCKALMAFGAGCQVACTWN